MKTITGGKGPPSRKRYDDSHRVRSLRLDEDKTERLDKLLEGLDLSYSEWVKYHIGKDENMIEKKADLHASKGENLLLQSLEDRLRCQEDLLHQLLAVEVGTWEYLPICPRCGDQDLYRCEGTETGPHTADPRVDTLKCPKCGYFVNTFRGIDPESIRWYDPDSGVFIKKPKSATSPGKKKH